MSRSACRQNSGAPVEEGCHSKTCSPRGLRCGNRLPYLALYSGSCRGVRARPAKALFELLAGPAPTLARSAVRYAGLLVVAIDGTMSSVPDTAANLTVYTRHRCPGGGGGCAQSRLLALLACGARTVIGAVFGTATTGETTWAGALAGQLKTGMLLLADRNFAAQDLLAALSHDGAHLLVRAKSGRRLLPIARLSDGTVLVRLGPLTVRVIDAEIPLTTGAGRVTGHYLLVTTPTDPAAHPALDLVRLYHEHWEIETCYAELKSTILGGRVLRAQTPAGIEQEIWALRPDRAGRRRHRRQRHRRGRRDWTPYPQRTPAGPPYPRQSPHSQARHLQVQRPRPEHRPRHLQSRCQHRDADNGHLTRPTQR